jgi:hypothetical protein
LWKNTFEEHYKDIERKQKLKDIEAKHLKKAKSDSKSEEAA